MTIWINKTESGYETLDMNYNDTHGNKTYISGHLQIPIDEIINAFELYGYKVIKNEC